ncbi:oxygenase [Lithospermum erythrorhizon]|uniref:Oxygenase n=1 Tax=Lithospermum erythrorhizon TaxID=34254 RepID=A0AAV3QXE7_LITER
MGSSCESNNNRLPVIEFQKNDLIPIGSHTWHQVKDQVHLALENYGCFEASFDAIPSELKSATLSGIEELFSLPLETKLKNTSKKPYHGYVGQYPMVPLYESMGFDDANILERVETIAHQFWPQGNPFFCKNIQSLSENLSELDKIIRRMVLESLGLSKYIDEHMESTNYLLRVMKYTAPQTNHSQLGLSAHTDKNIVTILCGNQVKGLEVETKDGEWIEVNPEPGHFVVMIGDSLVAWTNGRLHSPNHRVMMTGNDARYSAGLFSVPKAGYVIKAPEELVDEEHPLLFKPFDHVEFLKFYYTEAGQRAQYALKTYCGTDVV